MQGLSGVGMSNMFQASHLERLTDKLIERKDANGDGMLNVTELGGPQEAFAKVDTNADGQVDRAELIKNKPRPIFNRMAAHIIKQLDADESGALNIEEVGLAEELFNAVDQNQDGELDKKELGGLLQNLDTMANKLGAAEGQRQRPGGMRPQAGSDSSDTDEDTEDTVTLVDTNNDGIPDQEETTTFYPQLNIYQTTTVSLNAAQTKDDSVYL